MAASVAELTARVVALTDQVQTLTMRIGAAEHHAIAPRAGQSSDSGIFDKRKLYPKELKESTSLKTWSERFIACVAMENEAIAQAFTSTSSPINVLVIPGTLHHGSCSRNVHSRLYCKSTSLYCTYRYVSLSSVVVRSSLLVSHRIVT